MKITYTTNNNRLSVELEADSQKSLWQQLATFQEVFEESTCKKCDSENLRYVVRTSQDSKGKPCNYYELRCADCYAKMSFGLINDDTGTLFPKRKDSEGKTRGKQGWTTWNPKTKKEE